jgi:exopolysaccharide biosynthesis polyprenyl glycosylphosphotransferase
VANAHRFERELLRLLAERITDCSNFHRNDLACEFNSLSRFKIFLSATLWNSDYGGSCADGRSTRATKEPGGINQPKVWSRNDRSVSPFMSFGGIYIIPRRLVALSADVIWLALSAIALVTINCASMREPLNPALALNQAAAVVMVYLGIFYLMDLYDLSLVSAQRELLLNLVEAAGLVCAALGVLGALMPLLRFSPTLIFSHILLTALFVVYARAVINNVSYPLVDIGIVAGESARQKLDVEIGRRGSLGFSFHEIGKTIEEAQAALNNLTNKQPSMRTVVIDPNLLGDQQTTQFLETCGKLNVRTENLGHFVEHVYGKVILAPDLVRDLAASPIVSMPKTWHAMRRSRDIILSSLLFLLTLPISLLTIVAIRCESNGSVFFKQERIGQNGRPFRMLKFRSMFQDIKLEGKCAWITQEADPRVTRVGAILRKLHLDELPQLINVIKGEMCLVGPRPFHPRQVEELQSTMPYFGLRHLVKPGITGWAQIRCNYAASSEDQEEVLARDLYYVKHTSFLLDLLIMLDTIRICVWQKGAR